MPISKQKRFLFFFVHPSKYYLFRQAINTLKHDGHTVDIVIVTKDILENLIVQEGWEYTNIFPDGRQSKSKNKYSILWKTGINFFKTIYRLQRYTKGKKYDLYITDDCLVITGKFRNTQAFFFTDNELTTIPESRLLCSLATWIIAPQSVNLGKYESKKKSFKGYKELAYLHPDYFTPNINVVKKFNQELKRFFIIRLVAMTASHDHGLACISSEQLKNLIDVLEPNGMVYISSEKLVTPEFEKYVLRINPVDIAHVLFYADLFIGDSGTMASEAAVLGTPAIMYHDFIGRLGVMREKEEKYHLMYGFRPNDFDNMVKKTKELVDSSETKQVWQMKRNTMLKDCDDVNSFMVNLFINES